MPKLYNTKAHIIGVGVSQWDWPRNSFSWFKTKNACQKLAISCGIKALLDAGLSYDDVNLSISCGDPKDDDNDIFYAFGKTGIPIHKMDYISGLYMASHFIQTDHADCILLITSDQNNAIGVIFASEKFIWRHPYLKDVAVSICGCAIGSSLKGQSTIDSIIEKACREANTSLSETQIINGNTKLSTNTSANIKHMQILSSTTSLLGLCEIVWLLRGWFQKNSKLKTKSCLYYSTAKNGKVIATMLCRADGKIAPIYKEVEFKNDGRDRLGYNPTFQTKEVSFEDWESIKARDEFFDKGAASDISFRKMGGDRAALAKI